MVDKVNAVVLSGGSAFGLEAATGAVRWLEEQNMGWDVRIAKVPIVPAAILFDLPVGGNPEGPARRPTAATSAAAAATAGPVQEGSIGAGAGATVGKSGGPNRSMKAGLGSYAIAMPNGLVVAAIVAVNAVGDIVDPDTGQGRGRCAQPRRLASPMRACCCVPARHRRRRAPARTRPSGWWRPMPG